MQKIVIALISFLIIFLIPEAFAQIAIGTPAEHASLKIFIEENGDVHVIHEIKKNVERVQVSLIPGKVENLEVKNKNGDEVQFAAIGESDVMTLFPPTTNILIEYDLKDVLVLKNGIWTWDYLYTQSENSIFIFPDKVDLIYANERPVNVSKAEGMRCHGCQMVLEYVVDEPVVEYIFEWEGQEFPVTIRSLDEINSVFFDQSMMRLGFETTGGDKFITLIIPLELLWNPYEVYLDGDKIFKRESFLNDTHVWLNFRPETPGVIEILGVSAIPEFSPLLPFLLGIMIVVGFSMKNKINLH